jgi:hypothetical protein
MADNGPSCLALGLIPLETKNSSNARSRSQPIVSNSSSHSRSGIAPSYARRREKRFRALNLAAHGDYQAAPVR